MNLEAPPAPQTANGHVGGTGQAAAVLPLSTYSERTILVINSGSSTLKWSYFDTKNEELNARGQISRDRDRKSNREARDGCGGKDDFKKLFALLRDTESGVGNSKLEGLTLIAHRVVHGGTKFVEPTLLTPEVLAGLDELVELAPLHMPACLEGIREALAAFPTVPQVAVFDTAFHATIPLHARLYGLPYSYYEKLGIRRFGFHGLSHAYAVRAAAYFLNRAPDELNVVSCHLGGGASVCAVRHGRSMDITMGFSPGEGLLMGTRCGDIDPAVALHLMREKGFSVERVQQLINEESGLSGISGISADFLQLEAAAATGHRRAQLALRIFSYRLKKAIGAFVAALGGVDALVFTGGIGEGSASVRAAALRDLDFMGISLDPAANKASNPNAINLISGPSAGVAVIVVPCGEERMIAAEAREKVDLEYFAKVRTTRLEKPVPIETSAHHVHLSEAHLHTLFGPAYVLAKAADLSQPGQYASSQTVTVEGPAGSLDRVRLLGPVRPETQVEISRSDQFKLGLQPPIRESGDLAGSPGCILVGPAGRVVLDHGVICALRHIHMSPDDALQFGVRHGSVVRVRIDGDREMVYGDVKVRVHPDFRLAMHLDTDEANAGNLGPGSVGFIEGIQEPDADQGNPDQTHPAHS